MKVVFLADAPYIHEQRWIRHFVRAGYECDVITFRPAEIEGARVHYMDGVEALRKARYLVHARRVKQLIRELEPDLLHAMHLTSFGFLGALSGYRPFVLSVLGTDILEAPGLTPFHRWLTRYSLARADAITASGLHLATETARYAPRGKPVTVVPYGVDLERFRPAVRTSSDQLLIGTVARLSVEKGIRYLVEAFAALHKRFGGRVRLRIAGDGPERAALEALAGRLGISDAVEFRGWLPYEDVPAFLQGLDVFALPSVYEGFGVAAVEASAMALPVVASNVHGIPDVLSDEVTGLLVPSKDPQALSRALARLVEDAALRTSMGDAGRQYVASRYDWTRNAAQMERVYADVLQANAKEVRLRV